MAIFLLVAFGLSWLVALPPWFAGGPLGGLSLVVTGSIMMTTPSLAVLAWWCWERRHATPDRPAPTWRHLRRATGISTGFGTRRTVGVTALAWFGVPLLTVLAIGIVLLVGDVAAPPNLALAGISGVVGWVLIAVVCAALVRLVRLDAARVLSVDAEVAPNAPAAAAAGPGGAGARISPSGAGSP